MIVESVSASNRGLLGHLRLIDELEESSVVKIYNNNPVGLTEYDISDKANDVDKEQISSLINSLEEEGMFTVTKLENGELFLTGTEFSVGFKAFDMIEDMEDFLNKSILDSSYSLSKYRNIVPIFLDVKNISDRFAEYTFDIYYDGDSRFKVVPIARSRKEARIHLLKINGYKCRRVHLLVSRAMLDYRNLDVNKLKERRF